jgi:hypothetical protein
MSVQSTYGVTLTAGTAVAEVISITPPQSKTSAIQTSNLSTTGQTHTFIAGWEDPGEMSFEVNLTAANLAAMNTLANASPVAETTFVIAIPAPITLSISVKGFITSRGISTIAVGDDLIKASFTIKVSGACYV